MRCMFNLSEEDRRFLHRLGLPWESITQGNQRWLLIHEHPVPPGYNQGCVSLALQIPPGYPESPLDMMFVFPALARPDGKPIKATEHTEQIDGKVYQRWSRHLTAANPWRSGDDGLETYHDLVCDWLRREFEA